MHDNLGKSVKVEICCPYIVIGKDNKTKNLKGKVGTAESWPLFPNQVVDVEVDGKVYPIPKKYLKAIKEAP